MSNEKFIVPLIEDFSEVPEGNQFSKFQKRSVSSPKETAVNNLIANSNEGSRDKVDTTADYDDCQPSTSEKRENSSKPTPPISSFSSANATTSCSSTSSRTVTVSGRQKGNPLLRFLRNVPWEWGDTPGDYQISPSCCVLFLSAKYHKLHSEYIHQRFKKIGKTYAVEILLLLLDIEQPKDVLREINTMCFLTGCWTLLVCWSYEECAEYIEALKIFENKPTEFLMTNEKLNRQEKPDDRTILINLLTTIRSVTKADAENMIDAFGSLKNIVGASVDQLALCRGIGLLKAQRIFDAFSQPFVGKIKRLPTADGNTDVADEQTLGSTEVELEDELEIGIDD